jgi:DNA replication and repair protein RecF
LILIDLQNLAVKNVESNDAMARNSSAIEVSVARVTLTDFRCYAFERLECGPEPVVLSGPNGAGKTNLLEALSFLVPGRGLRRARLSEAGRAEIGGIHKPWAVAASIETPAGSVNLGTGLDNTKSNEGRERRAVHVNGEPVKSQAVLGEYLNALWLTPQMDRLFIEGPSARRRFLDRLVFGYDPAHAGRVAAYEKAMRERSRLLRDQGANADAAWLTALEETMAARGIAVVAARQLMAARLHKICAARTGVFPASEIVVTGGLESWLEEMPALAVETRFQEALAMSRPSDVEAGGTAMGPHKSDMDVRHLGNGQRAALCSTGEQKALLIALILANAELQAEERGSQPLLLLDEVAAHLDGKRRQALFDEILGLGAQAWMTGTDRSLFEPLEGRAQFFEVKDAALRRVS